MKGERKERQKLTKEGVVFAIIQNGNILLEKRLDPGDKLQGYIIIPGGKTKERESIWGTLSREIKEECDCIPKISSYLSTYSEQEDEINNVRHLFVVNAIEGEISNREPSKSEHIWAPLQKAREICEHPSTQLYLDAIEKFIKGGE